MCSSIVGEEVWEVHTECPLEGRPFPQEVAESGSVTRTHSHSYGCRPPVGKESRDVSGLPFEEQESSLVLRLPGTLSVSHRNGVRCDVSSRLPAPDRRLDGRFSVSGPGSSQTGPRRSRTPKHRGVESSSDPLVLSYVGGWSRATNSSVVYYLPLSRTS